MTVLVVLPGLDGTATLHEDFLRQVGVVFEEASVVAYPTDQRLGYAELERLIRGRLPADRPFFLLGESFSGPLAIAIAAAPPANLVGLVLSTTFAASAMPMLSPLAPLLSFAPVGAAPAAVLSWWLFGKWATPAWTARLQAALDRVSPAVLKHRAACSLRSDAAALLPSISMPVLYLRATHDRLLGRRTGERLVAAIANAELVDIPGPHLLLQAAPRESAAAVRAFVGRYHAGQR
jgi:pimeloyl-ACP methyl ester carboxylesterase